MFAQTWNKYLPVLRILLKRSASDEQTLSMNASDFQRAAGGRKTKFSFSITLHKGRLRTVSNPSVIAKEFVTVLQQDEQIRKYLSSQDIEFSLSNSFQLLLKNITPPEVESGGDNNSETSTEG
jgi:hypothetical protein